MKPGNIIFQQRSPGGICIIIKIFDNFKEYDRRDITWSKHDWPIIRVMHPRAGVIDDPCYYYCTIEEAIESQKRHLDYENSSC